MNRRNLLFFILALVGGVFLWAAITAEISLRYFKGSFLALFVLVTLGLVISNVITFQIVSRNTTSGADTKQKKKSNRRKPKPKDTKLNTGAKKGPNNQSSRRGAKPSRPKPANKNKSKSPKTGSSGNIKVYFPKMSYGFVEDDQGTNIFFHKTNLATNVTEKVLMQKPNVTFDIGKNERGPVAINIRIVE